MHGLLVPVRRAAGPLCNCKVYHLISIYQEKSVCEEKKSRRLGSGSGFGAKNRGTIGGRGGRLCEEKSYSSELALCADGTAALTPLSGWWMTASQASSWSKRFNSAACLICINAEGTGSPTGFLL